MTTIYHHQQFSMTAVVSFLIIAAILISLAWWVRRGRRVVVPLVTILFVLMAVVHYAFFSLTVDVSDGLLTWHFGPGVFAQRLSLSEIAGAETTQIPRWSELGAKCRPANCVYSISWGDAVELHLKNGQAIRIGTNDAQGLVTALSAGR